MSAVTAKEQARELVERLDPSQAEVAVRFLKSIVDDETATEAPGNGHRQGRMEWLTSHQEELKAYRGKWVVVEANGIVAADSDHDVAWRRAKELGIQVPLIFRVWENDLPFAGF